MNLITRYVIVVTGTVLYLGGLDSCYYGTLCFFIVKGSSLTAATTRIIDKKKDSSFAPVSAKFNHLHFKPVR